LKSSVRRIDDLIHAFRVKPGATVDLSQHETTGVPHLHDKEEAGETLKHDAEQIDLLQDRLYAEGRRALLVILQGMDTSGKDSTVAKVFGRTGPVGVVVTSFKKPTEEELAHDFLWRVHKALPRRGTIGIFNRSHYEDVLIGRVRKLADDDEIEKRYDRINGFEDLVSSSTRILKFMLHISKDEQKKRLQARLDRPEKRWKFEAGDIAERHLWDEYVRAYEIMLGRCSTKLAPWYVIPSDQKWARNAAVAAIVRATLEDMDPRYPQPDWDPASFHIE
jgi:PPK2 family polyphosphate:nucleotide phosphotransferase